MCGFSAVLLNGCISVPQLPKPCLICRGFDEECMWHEVPRAREGSKGMRPQRQLDSMLLLCLNFSMEFACVPKFISLQLMLCMKHINLWKVL